MSRLNRNAAKLMHKFVATVSIFDSIRYKAHACTDVTGFGILGHATNLVQNQLASVDFEITHLPIINKMTEVTSMQDFSSNNVKVAEKLPYFRLVEGYSAETSGGLLVALPAEAAEHFIAELQELDGHPAWIVGRVIPATGTTNSARIVGEDPAKLVIPVTH